MKSGLENQLKGYLVQIVGKNPGRYTFKNLVSKARNYSNMQCKIDIGEEEASRLVNSLLDIEIKLRSGEDSGEFEDVDGDLKNMKAYLVKKTS